LLWLSVEITLPKVAGIRVAVIEDIESVHNKREEKNMIETVIVAIFVALLGIRLYQQGKAWGSRRAYGIGLRRGRRR